MDWLAALFRVIAKSVKGRHKRSERFSFGLKRQSRCRTGGCGGSIAARGVLLFGPTLFDM